MNQYLFKVFPYLLGVIIYLGVGEYFLYRTGELRSIESIVSEQLAADHDSHFGKALIPGNHLYLLEHLRQREADIIVLGQSITHQFQARMFYPNEDAFFNASNIIQTLDDLDFVVAEIENGAIHRPEIIIWGLDPDYLKIQEYQQSYFEEGDDDPALDLDQHFRGIQIILKSIVRGNRTYVDFENKRMGYGINGMKGYGRKKDGSFDNSRIIQEYDIEPIYKERNDYENRLDDRRTPFESPLQLEQELILQFDNLVTRVEALDIDILFYCQQFSKDFMNHAMEDQEFRSFWNDFTDICDSLDNKGHHMILYGTPSDLGLDDRYMRDANHAAEVMTAIQLLDILEKKGAQIPALLDIDLDHLRLLIDNMKSEVEL